MFKRLPVEVYNEVRRRRFSYCMKRKGYSWRYIYDVLEDIKINGNVFCSYRDNFDVRECLCEVNNFVQLNYEKILEEFNNV